MSRLRRSLSEENARDDSYFPGWAVLQISVLQILPDNAIDLHVEDYTWITSVALGSLVMVRERVVESPLRIIFNFIDHTAKLRIGIRIIKVCNRDSYVWI